MHRHDMAYWYTIYFNTYRGLFGIDTWARHYQESRPGLLSDEDAPLLPLLILRLPIVSTILWCASNVLIAFVWYPCFGTTKNDEGAVGLL
jgi:hypothetical protein